MISCFHMTILHALYPINGIQYWLLYKWNKYASFLIKIWIIIAQERNPTFEWKYCSILLRFSDPGDKCRARPPSSESMWDPIKLNNGCQPIWIQRRTHYSQLGMITERKALFSKIGFSKAKKTGNCHREKTWLYRNAFRMKRNLSCNEMK